MTFAAPSRGRAETVVPRHELTASRPTSGHSPL